MIKIGKMKKLVFLVLLLVAVTWSVNAQNRSINFEQTKEWKRIVKKAKKEKKLVFIDCYTSWCGPCKMLASKIFTQDAVADFFNENFVNTKYDMEKDVDGVMLKDKFGVKAFPTLVFVDPETQEIAHCIVGARKAEELIAEGEKAKDRENNLRGMMKRYAAGGRSAEFLIAYMSTLAAAYQKDEVDKVAVEYLNTLSLEELMTKEGWGLINQYVKDPLSAPLKQVMENRSKFYTVASKVVIDDKLEYCINVAVGQLVDWDPESGVAFDEGRNRALIDYLQNIDFFVAAPTGLANLYTAGYVRERDFRGLLNKMKEVLGYNMFRSVVSKGRYLQRNFEALSRSEDKALLEEGIKWIDLLCMSTNEYSSKAKLMNSKALLQIKIGDTEGAAKSKVEEEQYMQEGQKKRNERLMRIRNNS